MSLFTTAAVMSVVPDLSLIASLNAVISLTSEIDVVVIAAEEVPLPIVKPIFPVACTAEISILEIAVAETPVNSVFELTDAATVLAEALAATDIAFVPI